MVQSENSAVCNRVLCIPVTHTPKKNCGGKTASTTSAHLRVTKEVVELDPASGGVSLEVGEHVSKQKPRHGRSLSAAQTA